MRMEESMDRGSAVKVKHFQIAKSPPSPESEQCEMPMLVYLSLSKAGKRQARGVLSPVKKVGTDNREAIGVGAPSEEERSERGRLK